MSTTFLFAEILVIGLQVGLWVFLLLLTIFGPSWLQGLQSKNVADWQAAIAVFLISLFYAFGIIFDRLADFVFSKWEERIRKTCTEDISHTTEKRYQIYKDNEYFSNDLEYTKSRMRIVRASCLNFGISTILALIVIQTRIPNLSSEEKSGYFFFVLIVGTLATASAIYAWYRLECTYFGLVQSAYNCILQRKTGTDIASKTKAGSEGYGREIKTENHT